MNTFENRQGLWSRLRHELRRAFTLPSERELTGRERAWLDEVAERIVGRRLTGVALMMLETLRPLHFLAGQALAFLSPVLTIAIEPNRYGEFVRLLEKQGAIDELAARIEELEAGRK